MAECTVLFFGHTAEIVGKRRMPMIISAGTTAREVFKDLISEYTELTKMRLLLSLNQQYASGDEIIGDGDELAVFTPVSGG